MTTPSVRALPSISQSLRLNSADLASLFYIHPATPFRGRGGMIVLIKTFIPIGQGSPKCGRSFPGGTTSI